MNAFAILVVTAFAQVAFLLALLVFLVDRRRRTRARHALVDELRREARHTLRAWLAGGGSIDAFIVDLTRMPGDAALEFASELSASILDAQSRETLSAALRAERWMQKTLAQATSRQWWRRRISCAA